MGFSLFISHIFVEVSFCWFWCSGLAADSLIFISSGYDQAPISRYLSLWLGFVF